MSFVSKSKLTIFAAIVILFVGASWVIKVANSSHNIPIIKEIPNFSFIDQDGGEFDNRSFENKITVLDFIFTNCTGPCPTMALNMYDLYDNFRNVPEVQFISITVDPINDTSEKLKEYSQNIGVIDNRWKFLHSSMSEVKSLKQDGFLLYAGELPMGHAIKFILIDQDGKIRKYYDGTDEMSQKILNKDITILVNELRS